MRKFILCLFVILGGCQTTTNQGIGNDATWSFIVLGDTAYNPADGPAYAELIAGINSRRPAFSIHVGDTKGSGSCGDDFQRGILDGFRRFEHPLIYTPGDNEWADCHKEVNGSADPLERLAAIRQIFFSTAASLGNHPLTMDVQSSDFPENRRWMEKRISFATVHIVGSADNSGQPVEYLARQRSNIEWINQTFDAAQKHDSNALVLAFQADMFWDIGSEDDAFRLLRDLIRTRSAEWDRPVLLVHGDGHRFVIDRPFYEASGDGEVYVGENVFRVQTFGAPELGAVEIKVSRIAPYFQYSPILVDRR